MTISSADEFYGGILKGFGEYNVTQFRSKISESWDNLSDEKRFKIAKEAGLSKNDATAVYRQSFEAITPYLRERIEHYELFEAYKGDSIKNPNAEFNKDVVKKARPIDPNKDRKDNKNRDAIDKIPKADDDENYSKLIGYIPEPNKDIGDNRTQAKGGVAKTPKGSAKESLLCANCGKTVVQSDHPDHLGICEDCTLLPTAQKMDAYAKIDAEQKDRNHPFNKGMRGEASPNYDEQGTIDNEEKRDEERAKYLNRFGDMSDEERNELEAGWMQKTGDPMDAYGPEPWSEYDDGFIDGSDVPRSGHYESKGKEYIDHTTRHWRKYGDSWDPSCPLCNPSIATREVLPYGNEFDRVLSGKMEGKDRAGQADNKAIVSERILGLSKEVWANEVDGDYLFDGQVIGRVTDLKPTEWFGKVLLNSMPEFAEYGYLDPQATVQGDDGNLYSDPKGGSDGSRGTLLQGANATVTSYDKNDDDFFKALGL